MKTIAAPFLGPLYQYARSSANQSNQPLPLHLLPEHLPLNPDSRISALQVEKQLFCLQEVMHDPLLGLKAGKSTDLNSFHMLGHLLMTAPTANLGAKAFCDYFGLIAQGTAQPVLTQSGHLSVIELPHLFTHPCGRDFFLATFLTWIKRIWTSQVVAVKLHCNWPKPFYWEQYQELAGCKVEFSQKHTALYVNTKQMHVPLMQGNKKLFDLLNRQLEDYMAENLSENQHNIKRLVEFFLKADSAATLEDIAEQLSMSARSLSRKLLFEGCNFRQIANQIKLEQAENMLAGSCQSISEIGEQIGFSERRSFERAFMKWRGESPAQFRHRNCEFYIS